MLRILVCWLAAGAIAWAAEGDLRIVSGGGAITETIYALNGADKLVAVDTTSLYPEAATKLPKIGYARQLSAEGILSMKPTVLVVHEDAGPPTVLEQVEKAGVKIVKLPNEHSLAGVEERTKKIGELLGKQAEADALIGALKKDLKTAEDAVAKEAIHPKVLFIYTRGGSVMNISGQHTAADAMITLAGGINAVIGYEGYKPLTAEAAVAASPDVILVTSGGLASAGGVDELLKQPGLAMTPAGQAKRIVALDDLLLLGFGPRLGQAVLELNKALYAKPQVAAQ